MAVNKNTYGLPDEMLQLIGSAPELNFSMPQQNASAQFATPGVRSSNLISALRSIPGAANPGFTRYANQANGATLSPTVRKTLNVISPARLTLPKYIAPPEVSLPGGDVQTPAVRPDPVVLPRDIIFDPVLPDLDPVVPDPVEPDPVTPDPEIPDVVVPDPEDPDPVDPDPDYIDPTELDPFELDPLVYPEEPTEERPGTVEITPVDPNEETPQDDGTTQGILDEINSWPVVLEPESGVSELDPFLPEPDPEPLPEDEAAFIDAWLAEQFGGGGGGKSVFDETLGSLEF